MSTEGTLPPIMDQPQYNPKDFDQSTFDTSPTQRFVETEWGRELIFTEESAPYQGKELQIRGEQHLELHTSDRFRLFYFREGEVAFEIEDVDGLIHTQVAKKNVGYRIQPGQRFGIKTSSDSRILEAYTSEAYQGEVDKNNFEVEPYLRKIDKPWGYEYHLAHPDDPLMAKILHIDEDKRLSEQVHDEKEETYFVENGNGQVVWTDNTGTSITTKLTHEFGWRTHVGQPHRLGGKEGGVDIFEVSTPESGNTWRTADDYGRPDETPQQREKEREGM
jgi:mannose-6-phosphate isomerase-like protein (cupin superfamily)